MNILLQVLRQCSFGLFAAVAMSWCWTDIHSLLIRNIQQLLRIRRLVNSSLVSLSSFSSTNQVQLSKALHPADKHYFRKLQHWGKFENFDWMFPMRRFITLLVLHVFNKIFVMSKFYHRMYVVTLLLNDHLNKYIL